MKNILLLVMLQICCLLSEAQVKNNVVKIQAFYQETVGGAVETDEQGNEVASPVDHRLYLYAETTGKILPEWKMVYSKRGVYKVHASAIPRGNTVVTIKHSKKPFVVSAKRGNRLWELDLIPVKTTIPPAIAALLKKNAVVVITEWKGKRFTHTISKEIELEPVFYK